MSVIKKIDDDIIKIDIEISNVKTNFEKIYKGDLTTLLNDIGKFQNSLSEIREKIELVKQKKTEFNQLKKTIFSDTEEDISMVSKIKKEYLYQKEKILSEWEKFEKIENNENLNSAQKSIMSSLLKDLDIEVIIDFDIDKFYSNISNCINGAEWRAKYNRSKQENYFKVSDLETFFSFLKDKFLKVYYDGGIHGSRLQNILFDENKRKEYLKVFPILKYKNKNLNKLSVGQKGTVYLKMMLATEAFSKPIIFDQPEDDLDNDFIIKNLISLFKELKKYRQVIIVTHNANLVVNADAEQIIIAQNNKGKLSYLSGSLENTIINEKICEILEGGKIAFEKRRNKYIN